MLSIVTDSTVDLTPELIECYGIDVIPYIVYHGQRTFHDGIDIDADGIYRLVDETGELPKTAAPPVADYIRAFNRPGEVIFTGIASALSAGFQNATLAAQELPPGNVRLVDPRNVTTGIGQLVLRAAEMRDEGRSADEVERELHDMVPRLRTSMVLDSLRPEHDGHTVLGQVTIGGVIPWPKPPTIP